MTWLGSLLRRRALYGGRPVLNGWKRVQGKGGWLGRLDEIAHLGILGVYFQRLTPTGGRILDVRCGVGLLLPHVAEHAGRYLGIDSAAAVQLAWSRSRRPTRCETDFRVADIDSFVSDEVFDAIVFCESLYYLRPLAAGLQTYLGALAPEGVLLASVPSRRNHEYIWRELDRLCDTLDAVYVENTSGAGWNIRALRPKQRPGKSSVSRTNCRPNVSSAGNCG